MQSNSQDLMMEAVTAEEAGEFDKAFSLFEILANEGDTYAMSDLGRFYEDGLGSIDIDFDQSIYWSEKSAKAGNTTGMNNLAVTYRRMGEIRKSREWFEKALEHGDISAALPLAQLHMVSDKEFDTVRKYLGIVLQGTVRIDVSEGDLEDAKKLLNELNAISNIT